LALADFLTDVIDNVIDPLQMRAFGFQNDAEQPALDGGDIDTMRFVLKRRL
jgi:hypothetical protein